jgi:hypothetical protein
VGWAPQYLRTKRANAAPLVLSQNDWLWEATQVERSVEHEFANAVYAELNALFAEYALRRVWDGAQGGALGRTLTLEVFAQCDDKRAFCIARKVVKLRHHRTDPARTRKKWMTLFVRAAVAFARALRPKLKPTAAAVLADHQRRLRAVGAKARREQRLIDRAPKHFDELEKLTD